MSVKDSRLALVLFLALSAGAFSAPASASQTPPATKKSPAKKVSVKKVRAKKVSAAPAKKKPIARIPARKPLPPSAEIPTVVEAASVWRGCMDAPSLPKLASNLGMDPVRLTAMLDEVGSAAPEGGCVAYVAATGGESGAASVIFRHSGPSGETQTLAIQKTPDGIVATPGVCDCREASRRILSLPAREFPSSLDSDSASIPSNLRWQLNVLVPRMMTELSAKGIAEEPAKVISEGGPSAGNMIGESDPQPAETSIDNDTVRIVIATYPGEEKERLESVEIIDPASGKRMDGAWWLDRPDGPGAFIGMDGVSYERLLWESPIKYKYESRGVGASVTTLRRRVPVKKGAKATVVQTIKVAAYHLGVDMIAPKGTEVHAVGDAKVSFAGRMGGFGNLIILDHGRGYQTYYAHLSKIGTGIKPGVSVARGDMIGLVGSTGHSTAPHLHFETRKDKKYLDPFDETHQLGFWLLTADEQERLAMQLLSAATVAADDETQH